MCIVCVEWQAGKLTSKEALKNLGELIKTEDAKDHYFLAVDKILDKEMQTTVYDDETDTAWHKETYGD